MIVTRRSVLAGLAAVAAFPGHGLAAELLARRPPLAYRLEGLPIAFQWDDDAEREAVHEVMKRADWRFQWLSLDWDELRAVALHLPTGFAYVTLPDDTLSPGHEIYLAHGLARVDLGATGGSTERELIGRAAAFLAAEMFATNDAIYVPTNWWSLGDVDYPENQPRPTHPLVAGLTGEGFLLNV